MPEEAADWTSPVSDVCDVRFNPPKHCWMCCSPMGFYKTIPYVALSKPVANTAAVPGPRSSLRKE